MLVHHTRKPNGSELTVDDARGASALLAAVRSARALNTMTKKEAELADLPDAPLRSFFRADIGKTNLSPPPDNADWFKITSVELNNGDAFGDPFGDNVGVVTPWKYPKIEAIQPAVSDIQEITRRIQAGGPWNRDQRAKLWAGMPVAEALGLDLSVPTEKKSVDTLITTLIQGGVLEVFEARDAQSKNRKYVRVRSIPPVLRPAAADNDVSR